MGSVRRGRCAINRMFDMTNDSHLFRTASQLDADGFYRVDGGRWKRGEEVYLPLYQGRMIGQFDHRANSVRVNPNSVHNPYLSEEISVREHADPGFLLGPTIGSQSPKWRTLYLTVGVTRLASLTLPIPKCENCYRRNCSESRMWQYPSSLGFERG